MAVDPLPVATAPVPTAVVLLPVACELLPSAVLLLPDATEPVPPAEEFGPGVAGGVLLVVPLGEVEVNGPPLLLMSVESCC